MERPGFLARLFSWPLEVLVRAYQLLLSPLLPRSCRYYPSCSAYALESLRRFGVLRGTWLGARRLGRCHPWCAGGVDHVPPRRSDGRPDWKLIGPRPNDVKLNGHSWAMMFSRASASNRLFFPARA